MLRQAEIRAVLRILGECRELGDDALVWRRHFFEQAGRLIDADCACGGEMLGVLSGALDTRGAALWGFDGGFNMDGLKITWEWNAIDPEISQIWVAYRDQLRQTPQGAAWARPQLIDDARWDGTPDRQQVMRTLGADAVLHSFHALAEGGETYEGVCWFRGAGRPDFDEREVALLELLHGEVTRLIGGPLASFAEPQPSALPQRLRRTLKCLLEGDGDKQMAARLNLSVHTVNGYTKEVFRYFGVESRAALLARWVRRGWTNRADWNAADEPAAQLKL